MKKNNYEETPLEQLSDAQLEEFLNQMEQPIQKENIENIQQQFATKIKEKNMVVLRQRKKQFRTILLVAALFVLIPTSVFAASKLWEMLMTKNQYEVNLAVKTNNQVQNDVFYKLELGYLPEDMVGGTDSLKYGYEKDLGTCGFSFVLWKLNQASNFSVLNVKDYSETTYGNRPAWLVQGLEEQRGFTRRVFIAFEEEGYMLEVYISKDVPNEEMTKVLNHVELKEVPENEASLFINYDDYQQQLKESEKERAKMKVLPLPKESRQLFNIGEKVPITLPNQGEGLDIELSIDSIDYLDSIGDIEIMAYQLEELTENHLIDDQGNFLEYQEVTYQAGDGKQRIDKKVKEAKNKLTYLSITATIENKSKQNWVDAYISPNLKKLEELNDSWVYPKEETFRRPYGSTSYELAYFDQHGEGDSYYKMADMKPQEKRQIKLGYLVPESDIDSLFIDLFNYGQDGETDDLNAENRWWVDLRQLK